MEVVLPPTLTEKNLTVLVRNNPSLPQDSIGGDTVEDKSNKHICDKNPLDLKTSWIGEGKNDKKRRNGL